MLERSHEQELNANTVYAEVAWRMQDIAGRGLQAEMGVKQTELTDVPVPGPHRLLALDETVQPGRNFKYNGASYAVRRLTEEYPEVQTVVTGTAGNFGSALAAAANRCGLQAEIYAPKDLSETKRQHMSAFEATIDDRYDDVLEAIQAAEETARVSPPVGFLHPFNNLDAIAGQAMIGRRLLENLQRTMEENGDNLAADPVVLLVQRGGGSLITGIACALQEQREVGRLGANVQIREVRPELLAGGTLDARYDGLAVSAPGSYAKSVLADRNFVNGTAYVNEADTGRAAARMYRAFGKRFEPSGLAGAAAYEREAANNRVPTTYVTILSGANTTAERFADFMDAPRREQHKLLTQTLAGQISLQASAENPTSMSGVASTSVWSGYQFR